MITPRDNVLELVGPLLRETARFREMHRREPDVLDLAKGLGVEPMEIAAARTFLRASQAAERDPIEDVVRNTGAILRAMAELRRELRREPNSAEVADRAGIPVVAVSQARRFMRESLAPSEYTHPIERPPAAPKKPRCFGHVELHDTTQKECQECRWFQTCAVVCRSKRADAQTDRTRTHDLVSDSVRIADLERGLNSMHRELESLKEQFKGLDHDVTKLEEQSVQPVFKTTARADTLVSRDLDAAKDVMRARIEENQKMRESGVCPSCHAHNVTRVENARPWVQYACAACGFMREVVEKPEVQDDVTDELELLRNNVRVLRAKVKELEAGKDYTQECVKALEEGTTHLRTVPGFSVDIAGDGGAVAHFAEACRNVARRAKQDTCTVQVNLNDQVSFRVTPHGREIHELNDGSEIPESGHVSMSLWNFANIFGQSFAIGSAPVTVDNVLQIKVRA